MYPDVLTDILIPRLAPLGGMAEFARRVLNCNLVATTEIERRVELHDKLLSHGYPPNLLQLLDMFEADTMNLLLKRFALTEKEIGSLFDDDEGEFKLKLNPGLQLSDFDKLDLNLNNQIFYNNETTGYIRVLTKLPKTTDESGRCVIDIGL